MAIKLILILFGLIFVWLIRRVVVGHKIGVCLGDFEKIYDEVLSNTHSKSEAFKKGAEVFKQCYPFNKLSYEEWGKVNNAFGVLSNPKEAFIKIMLCSPSKKALNLLRNNKFLEEVKLIGKNK